MVRWSGTRGGLRRGDGSSPLLVPVTRGRIEGTRGGGGATAVPRITGTSWLPGGWAGGGGGGGAAILEALVPIDVRDALHHHAVVLIADDRFDLGG